MQEKQNEILQSRLDKEQYSDNELISIKTSLNLPYYVSSPAYERAYGSVTVNGEDYEYVKRRVYKDTLELLCLPNHAKTNLQAAKNEFFQLSIVGQSSQSEKKSGTILKISLPDYCQEFSAVSIHKFSQDKKKYFSANTGFLMAGYSSRKDRPPQSIPA